MVGYDRVMSETQDTMAKLRAAVAESGLTYQVIGERMGYQKSSARQSVSQALKGQRLTVVMLMKFAEALGVEAGDLL